MSGYRLGTVRERYVVVILAGIVGCGGQGTGTEVYDTADAVAADVALDAPDTAPDAAADAADDAADAAADAADDAADAAVDDAAVDDAVDAPDTADVADAADGSVGCTDDSDCDGEQVCDTSGESPACVVCYQESSGASIGCEIGLACNVSDPLGPFCDTPCTVETEASDCGVDVICGDDGFCTTNPRTSTFDVCRPCTADEQCRSGTRCIDEFCLLIVNETTECPAGYPTRQSYGETTDPNDFSCAPNTTTSSCRAVREAGEDCGADAPCVGENSVCVPRDTGDVCSYSCLSDVDCLLGFSCQPTLVEGLNVQMCIEPAP